MLSLSDQQKSRFSEGDRVTFRYRKKIVEGRLTRMNPKRAVVRIGNDNFTVPYELLTPRAANTEERLQKMTAVQELAVQLMHENGLQGWAFKFDHSSRRAGCCYFRDKLITLAFDLARTGSDKDIRNTILHEIAHARVGKKHNHDAVWKAKAREIGCTGERTHKLQFSPPRWSVTCENRCWSHTAQQRNSRLICRTCGSRLLYTPYSAPA